MYPEAIGNFSTALKLKPGNPTAFAKLASAEKLLASANADKAKLEEKFGMLISAGDQNVQNKKYLEAIENFKEAIALKPDNTTAKEKLSDAEQLLASANAEKAKLEEEFKRLLARGDDNVSKQMYQEAIGNFNRALKVKPGDQSALSKLVSAEKLLASEIQSDLKAKGLALQKQAEVAKMTAKDNAYADNVKKGDESFAKFLWSMARFYYIEAIRNKPDDQYAMGKIEVCDKMTDANITSERILEYKLLISKGSAEFASGNYTTARFYYRNSLEILPWESMPKEKLKEIDQLFNEKMSQADRQLLKENLQKADDALLKKEYSIARFYYAKANEINQDEYITGKLKEIQNIVSGSDPKRISSEYEAYIKKADEASQQKNISLARFYYQKATLLKPDESYSRDQLKKLSTGN